MSFGVILAFSALMFTLLTIGGIVFIWKSNTEDELNDDEIV